MPQAPEVSVVMGVRNGGRALAPTLDSILRQVGVMLELVVVDDGSSDDTPELLESYARRDARLRVLRQSPLGLTAALARGCAEARAALIARHDADDLSHPDRLARQKALFDRHSEVVLASCWTLCLGPEGEFLFVERRTATADQVVAVFAEGEPLRLENGPTSHGSAMFRRDAYQSAGGYRIEFALGQDWDLWQRLGLLGRFYLIGEPLYARRFSATSLTSAFHDLQMEFGRLSFAAVTARHEGRSEEGSLAAARELGEKVKAETGRRRRSGRARGHYHVGEILRRRGDARCRRYFRAALRSQPWSVRGWVRMMQSLWLAPRSGLEGLSAGEVSWAVGP